MSQLSRFLIAGVATVGLYVGGVWLGTDVMALPARPVNAFFYVLATSISFALAYFWIFNAQTSKGAALFRYILLQAFGVVCNAAWLEAGLRLTPLLPWVIAAAYFAVWPFISFTVQQKYIFK